MLSSVLVANRGEIACRIIRTAKALGIRTIAVYSEADAKALHAALADEAHPIGPAEAAKSYLDQDAILRAASVSGAASIHPGYGFLAENAAFAEACADAGIVFIGPSAAAIRAMGLKDGAKALMEKAGVPVVPGFHGERQEPAFLKEKAYEIGYPVLIKAVAGGGGKGMRRVDKVIEFEEALQGAVREAQAAFGDPRVLIEKFVSAPRHIEIQVFGDTSGHVIHLGERDCSLQRRHQKVIEEAPAPGMTPGLRARMGEAAVAAAKAVVYTGAGTVEFIADGSKPLSDDTPFFFMEMNTRLQVEHPVTEEVTGVDLVEWQFRVADGELLPLKQEDVSLKGHAVEARVYAEDPDNGFLPSSGPLEAVRWPKAEAIRIDTGVREGDSVTPYYDPMIAKVTAKGNTRDAALDALSNALGNSVIAGPRHNLGFLKALADAKGFREGRFDTGFIARWMDERGDEPDTGGEEARALAALALIAQEEERIAAMMAARSNDIHSPWAANDSFQLGGPRAHGLALAGENGIETADLRWEADGTLAARPRGGAPRLDASVVETADGLIVLLDGRQWRFSRPNYEAGDAEEGDGVVRAPMHGSVVEIAVKAGDQIEKGDRVGVVEAMKMEHAMRAPVAGVIEKVLAEPGAQVAQGDAIAVIAGGD